MFQKTLLIPISILSIAIAGLICIIHKPDDATIQTTTDFKLWKNSEPITGLKFAKHTFVVHCQLGQFFRICSSRQTMITQFLPDTNGLAVIHFEYLN